MNKRGPRTLPWGTPRTIYFDLNVVTIDFVPIFTTSTISYLSGTTSSIPDNYLPLINFLETYI